MRKILLLFFFCFFLESIRSQQLLGPGINRFDIQSNQLTVDFSMPYQISNLVQAQDGLFYGLVHAGDASRMYIFSYDAVSKDIKYRHSIDETNSYFEQIDLVKASDGLLYGYTRGGGKYNMGYYFSFDPLTDNFVNRLDFSPEFRGISFMSSLIEGKDGLFYGLSYEDDLGTIISIDFNKRTTKVHHVFTKEEGTGGIGRMVIGNDGLFYGMLVHGADYLFFGSLFSFDPQSDEVDIKFRFNGFNGAWPQGSLVASENGKLYGTTGYGLYSGTVFSYDPSTNKQDIIENFENSSIGGSPMGTLVKASNGLLYGTFSNGIFSVDPITNQFKSYATPGTLIPNNKPGNEFVEIRAIPMKPSVSYIGPASVQYSDSLQLKAVLLNPHGNPLRNKMLYFKIGENEYSAITNNLGEAKLSIKITQAPSQTELVAEFRGDEHYKSAEHHQYFEILPENAVLDYTGATEVSTMNGNSSLATITISATIRDISAVKTDAHYDADNGDIRKASLVFFDQDNGALIAKTSVYLIEKGDSLIASSIYRWNIDIGNSNEKIINLGIRIEGNYSNYLVQKVRVSRAVGLSLSGGGTINGPGGKSQFNIALKQEKKGIVGNAGINLKYSYQEIDIRNVNFYSFGSLDCQTATVNAVCDVIIKSKQADEKIPGALVQWEISEANNGKTDLIKITGWSAAGQMLFSTHWNGSQTSYSFINGSMKIEGCGNSNIKEDNRKTARVYPNPAAGHFLIDVPGSGGKIVSVRIFDQTGKLVDDFKPKPGTTLKFGEKYKPGIYTVIVNNDPGIKIVKIGN